MWEYFGLMCLVLLKLYNKYVFINLIIFGFVPFIGTRVGISPLGLFANGIWVLTDALFGPYGFCKAM